MSIIDDEVATTLPSKPTGSPILSRVLRFRELAIVVAIALVFGATYLKNSQIASAANVQQLLSGPAIIILLAVGETLVIITRNVDLSVGSVLGLSAYLDGVLFEHNPHLAVPLALLAGLGVGLVCGMVNGVIVVVTLGMLYIVRGVDAIVVNGHQIDPSSIPQSFVNFGSNNVLGIPILFIVAVVAVAIVGYAMRSFRAARDLYAIGSNPDAAVLAGIPVQRRIFSAFAISGALAGLGGALYLAQLATVSSVAGTGYELNVVAAVVVGGVAIFGGSGTVLGAALGALLLNTINGALDTANIAQFWHQAIAGAMLLAAIAFDRFVVLRTDRVLRVEGAQRDNG